MSRKQTTSPTDINLEVYNDTFFKQRAAWRSDYIAIAKWINKNIEGTSFGDIGCGNGIIIESLLSSGKTVWGVDGAQNSKQFVDKKVRKHFQSSDLTNPHNFPPTDVVLCFEVAERINKKYADTLIKSIASTGAGTVIFTAGQPGEAGIHHVNLQPHQYWINKFAQEGYCLDPAVTEHFRHNLSKSIKNLTWYLDDIMIFQKCDDPRIANSFARAGEAVKELKYELEDLSIRHEKLKEETWIVGQALEKIVNSKRWNALQRFMRYIGR